MSEENYSLICPFLTDDFMFAAGAEFGMFFDRLKEKPDELKDYVLRENQDRVCLLAGRLGYQVVEMEPWDESWLFVHIRRIGAKP